LGRAASWHGFAPADVASLDDTHIDVDYRTFSRRILGDSKVLERIESAVIRR
jgi:hypothetical protein